MPDWKVPPRTPEQRLSALFSCSCSPGYHERAEVAPDCPRCNYYEDALDVLKDAIEERDALARKVALWEPLVDAAMDLFRTSRSPDHRVTAFSEIEEMAARIHEAGMEAGA